METEGHLKGLGLGEQIHSEVWMLKKNNRKDHMREWWARPLRTKAQSGDILSKQEEGREEQEAAVTPGCYCVDRGKMDTRYYMFKGSGAVEVIKGFSRQGKTTLTWNGVFHSIGTISIVPLSWLALTMWHSLPSPEKSQWRDHLDETGLWACLWGSCLANWCRRASPLWVVPLLEQWSWAVQESQLSMNLWANQQATILHSFHLKCLRLVGLWV